MADRYTVGESGSASLGAAYRKTDENCAGSLPSLATAGSVTFSEIDSSTIRGTFDLTFTNDHVTGDFTAPVCDTGNVPPSLTCTH
jgi:hypothetical protein